MSEKIKYISLERKDADTILNKFKGNYNQVIKIKPGEFPSINTFPVEYAKKLETVTVSVSASTFNEEPIRTINCIFHRKDKNKIDQDEFGFYLDCNTNTPSSSGCMLYHGNWNRRTDDYIKAKNVLSQVPDDLEIALEDSSDSFIDGHKSINKRILKMKKIIQGDE